MLICLLYFLVVRIFLSKHQFIMERSCLCTWRNTYFHFLFFPTDLNSLKTLISPSLTSASKLKPLTLPLDFLLCLPSSLWSYNHQLKVSGFTDRGSLLHLLLFLFAWLVVLGEKKKRENTPQTELLVAMFIFFSKIDPKCRSWPQKIISLVCITVMADQYLCSYWSNANI